MITNRGRDLLVSMEYSAPASRVWEIITDTQLWPQWGPSVARVDCSDRFIKNGSTGRVKTIIGLWLPFTVTSYKEGEFWAWKIGRVHATGHEITNLESSRCRLAFTMPWWAVPYVVVCLLALHRIKKILLMQK